MAVGDADRRFNACVLLQLGLECVRLAQKSAFLAANVVDFKVAHLFLVSSFMGSTEGVQVLDEILAREDGVEALSAYVREQGRSEVTATKVVALQSNCC